MRPPTTSDLPHPLQPVVDVAGAAVTAHTDDGKEAEESGKWHEKGTGVQATGSRSEKMAEEYCMVGSLYLHYMIAHVPLESLRVEFIYGGEETR